MEPDNTLTPSEAQAQARALWEKLDEADAKGETLPPDTEAPAPAPAPTEATETANAPAQPQGTAATKAAPADAATADSAAKDATQQELLGLRQMVEQLSSRLRNAEGHIGGLNHQQKQLIARAVEAAKPQPNATPAQAAKSSEKLARLREQFPDIADAIEEAMGASAPAPAPEPAPPPAAKAPAPEAAPQLTPDALMAEVDSRVAHRLVEMKHPKWTEKVSTPRFLGWLQVQPADVQALAGSKDPSDAIALLDRFDEALKPTAAPAPGQRTTKQSLASAAAMPTGRGATGASRTKPIEEMTPEEYWRHLDELDKQKA